MSIEREKMNFFSVIPKPRLRSDRYLQFLPCIGIFK